MISISPTTIRAFRNAVYPFTQFVIAARTDDFAAALQNAGIGGPGDAGLFDDVSGFSEAIDHHCVGNDKRTNHGEMAQSAAVEVITVLISQRSQSLFGTTSQHRTVSQPLPTISFHLPRLLRFGWRDVCRRLLE